MGWYGPVESTGFSAWWTIRCVMRTIRSVRGGASSMGVWE